MGQYRHRAYLAFPLFRALLLALALISARDSHAQNGGPIQFTGIVESVTSDTMIVSQQHVSTSTIELPIRPEVGMNVTVSGTLLADGTIIASQVIILAQTTTGTPDAPTAGSEPVGCPRDILYWTEEAFEWPVDELTLGAQNYSEEELLDILGAAINNDTSLRLARSLIVTKFNLADGASVEPISEVIRQADQLLSGFPGKVPYDVLPTQAFGSEMITQAGLLERYNAGLMIPECLEAAEGTQEPSPTSPPTATDTAAEEPTLLLTSTDTATREPTSSLLPTGTDTATRAVTPTLLPTATDTATLQPTSPPTATDTATRAVTPTLLPTATVAPIPGDGLTGEYFDRNDLTGLRFTRTDPTIDFHWSLGSPGEGIGTDRFSARWTGYVVPLHTETYTFYTYADDGVRLWVNDQEIINRWTRQEPTEDSGTIALQAGQPYPIMLEYFETNLAALVQLSWSSAQQPKQVIPQRQLYTSVPPTNLLVTPDPVGATVGGLTGEYFDDEALTEPLFTRIDPYIDFDWGWGAPGEGMGAETFSERWTGYIVPLYSETYTFYTYSDDGVRLWVDNQLIVDNWTIHTAAENHGTIALEAGQPYPLRLEHFQNGGRALIRLAWSSASQVEEIVPTRQLLPATQVAEG